MVSSVYTGGFDYNSKDFDVSILKGFLSQKALV